MIEIFIPGPVKGKARARTVRNKYNGKTVSYTPDGTVLYENLIKELYLNKSGHFFEGPLEIIVEASFAPPKSASKKKAGQMLSGEVVPEKKPDIDNIIKVVCDALNGIAYHDDKQIISVTAKKQYAAKDGLYIAIAEA